MYKSLTDLWKYNARLKKQTNNSAVELYNKVGLSLNTAIAAVLERTGTIVRRGMNPSYTGKVNKKQQPETNKQKCFFFFLNKLLHWFLPHLLK